MQQFVRDTTQELEEILMKISFEPDKLSRLYQSLEAIKKTLLQLREYIKQHPFAEKAEEIFYFKKLAPPIYADLFFRVKEYRIELEKRHASRERIESLLVHELEGTEKFYEFHQDIYKYFYERDTRMDDRIFIRDRSENMMLDEVEVIMGADFCVGCYWTARLLANEQLKDYLKKELDVLRNPPPPQPAYQSAPGKLKWTDTPTDLVELMYALFYKGSFNHGNANIKQIAEVFGEVFGVEIENVYRTGQEARKRKKTPTKYLDELKQTTVNNWEE